VPELVSLLPLIGIALLFWLFIIRPAGRRQRELAHMQSSLSVGDEIVLTSGVYGTVRQLEDDHLLVEVAPGVTIKVARGAVGSTVNKIDEPVREPAETDDQPGPVAGSEEN
jgi:preprotein translocase subunit YajC